MTDANENTVTAADHERNLRRKILRLRRHFGWSLGDMETPQNPIVRGALADLDALLSEHAAELARAQQEIKREREAHANTERHRAQYHEGIQRLTAWETRERERAEQAERELVEARADNERLTADTVDVALWVVAIESWPIEERVEWVNEMRPRVMETIKSRRAALAAAQEPPAERGFPWETRTSGSGVMPEPPAEGSDRVGGGPR